VAKTRVEKYAKYSREFRRMAVQRLKQSDNITALAKELGVERRLLYYWRDRAGRPGPKSREGQLLEEVSQLKQVLAEKTLEIDFFKGALQKVAARRPASDDSGGTASTTKSGK
jgi:transposase-like protein